MTSRGLRSIPQETVYCISLLLVPCRLLPISLSLLADRLLIVFEKLVVFEFRIKYRQ